MKAFVGVVTALALCATARAEEQAGIHLSLEGRLMESGLQFSPGGETRYRVSDYMRQLWMASAAQTLATRGQATACSTDDWTEESARFECPLGQDDYTFEHSYSMRSTDPVDLFREPWMGDVLDARWTLTSQYEARELKAAVAARRMSKPSGSGNSGGR